MCVELEITRARLTMLTKEYCGLTAQELVDGMKVRELRRHMYERLRAAAYALWGTPGSFVEEKYYSPQRHRDAENGNGSLVSGHWERNGDGGRDARGTKRRMTAEDYANESRGEERARRIGELVERLRRDFDMEEWAVEAGFASGARLKRAVLNVMGRTLKSLERMLAAEVVRYYICAEEKVLREIARRPECGRVARARWLYHKSEDAPVEPFLDEWSKAEELTPEWLEKMRAGLGQT
jgi:hypothetical protein